MRHDNLWQKSNYFLTIRNVQTKQFLNKFIIVLYLMTAMLIMGKYFPYLTAGAVSSAVMEVEKIRSHLPGGKESTFLTSRSVVKVTFLPSDS